jgi:hypothetical protein
MTREIIVPQRSRGSTVVQLETLKDARVVDIQDLLKTTVYLDTEYDLRKISRL